MINIQLKDVALAYGLKEVVKNVTFSLKSGEMVGLVGKSGVGKYGDSVVELDQRTGEVLDAIEDAGIKDKTIVIFVSGLIDYLFLLRISLKVFSILKPGGFFIIPGSHLEVLMVWTWY